MPGDEAAHLYFCQYIYMYVPHVQSTYICYKYWLIFLADPVVAQRRNRNASAWSFSYVKSRPMRMISGKQLLSANDKMWLFFLKNSSHSAVMKIFLKGIGVVLSNDLQSILSLSNKLLASQPMRLNEWFM